jgi:hypothetical protein
LLRTPVGSSPEFPDWSLFFQGEGLLCGGAAGDGLGIANEMKTNLFFKTGILNLLFLVLLSLTAKAQLTITEGASAVPEAGAILDNLSSQNDPLVTLNAGSAYVTGSLTARYDAPVFSSISQPLAFGQGSYTGAIQGQYLAVYQNGSVTLSFNAEENYFGLLWGSVDSYNELSFYDGSTLVGSIGGNQIKAGAQGSQNVYVNIDSLQSFNTVVASSSGNSFEFADIAYGSASNTSPAAPAPPLNACLAFAGILALQAVRRSQLA